MTVKITRCSVRRGADRDRGIVRRESDGVGEDYRAPAPRALVAGEVPISGSISTLEFDAVGRQPVLGAWRRPGWLFDVDRAEFSFIAPASMVARSRMLLVSASSALVDLVT